MQKSFTFHESWKNVISGLPAQVRLEVYDAIMEYGLSGTLTELKATAGLAFAILKNDIDADNHRAETIRRKRSEAGKRHKGNQYSILLEQNGTNGTSVPINRNKCSKEPLYKGVSDGCKNGTSVPIAELKEEKEPLSPIPPYQEKQENTHTQLRAREKFVKPTVEEVRAYVTEKGYDSIDPEVFWNFYEANGWVQGRQQKPIKNWKACVTTWRRNPQYSHYYATTQTNKGPNQGSEHPTDSELREQSVRLMQRLADERHARQTEVRQRTEFPTENQS